MSTLGLGCWAFGGDQWGGQDDEQSAAAMQAAFEAGITHFDTARAYGEGKSERVLRPFLDHHRDAIYLASKGNAWGGTAQELREQLEASLKDLGVDQIDLYYLHWPKSDIDLKALLAELEKARSEGKIKAIGVSNFTVEHMRSVADVAKIDAYQVGYSLLWRTPESDIIPYCRESGIDLVTYSSIAQGILTGKFGQELPTFPDGDDRSGNALFDPKTWPHIADAVESMKKLAEAEGQPLVNLAVQWVAQRPGVKSVLLGARDAAQAHQNAAALQKPVSNDTITALTEISDAVLKHQPKQSNIFGFNP